MTSRHPEPPELGRGPFTAFGVKKGPLHVAQVVGPGGAAVRHVRGLAAGLVAREFQVDVYCSPVAAERAGLGTTGAMVMPLEIGGGARDAAAVAALRRMLRERPVDVLHAHGLAAGAVAALARPAGLPLVVTWHTGLATHGPGGLLRRSIARSVAAAAEVNLVASAKLLAAASGLGARDVRPALIAPPPLPAPRRTPEEVRAEFGLPPEAPVVLAAGRLVERKRFDVLIEAAQRWRKRTPQPRVLLAGVGPAFRRLTARVAITRAPVVMVGWREDMADLLSAADVAVVTGSDVERDAFAQEALMAGTPLVSTDSGDQFEVLGSAAVQVPAGDVDALDGAVSWLLDDPAARRRLATAAREQAANWPTEAAVLEQVVGVYAELAAVAGEEPGRAGGT